MPGNSMHYLKAVNVDEELVSKLWHRVGSVGSFYSIADGASKDHFRHVLYSSDAVLQGPGVFIRLEARNGSLEVHPIVVGHEAFHFAHDMVEDIASLRDERFAGKAICCIIPEGMRGAKRLAEVAGMKQCGRCKRSLSGVEISCAVYSWR